MTTVRLAWLLLGGVWLALAYTLAGLLLGLVTLGGRDCAAALAMARYALWPFGRRLSGRPATVAPTPAAGRYPVLWLALAGWWLVLVHVLLGVALSATVIGLPFGVVVLTLIPVALFPAAAEVGTKRTAPTAVVVSPARAAARVAAPELAASRELVAA